MAKCFPNRDRADIYAHAQSRSSVNRFNWAEEAECVTVWNPPCLEIPPAGVPLACWPLVLKTGGGMDSSATDRRRGVARFTSHCSRPEHQIAPGSHKDQITTRLHFRLLRDLSRISLRASHNMMISPLNALVSILLVALTVSRPAVSHNMQDLRSILKLHLELTRFSF